jgi:hypothetical protein
VVVGRTWDHDDLGGWNGVGEEVIEEEAIDDTTAQVLDTRLIDLNRGRATLRVRLIQASIWDLLIGSLLDFCIQIDYRYQSSH